MRAAVRLSHKTTCALKAHDSDVRLPGDHLLQGTPAGKLRRRQRRRAACSQVMRYRAKPAARPPRQVDTLVHHQTGDQLAGVPPPNLQLPAQMQLVTDSPGNVLNPPN